MPPEMLPILDVNLDWDDSLTTLFPLSAIAKRYFEGSNLNCAATAEDVPALKQHMAAVLKRDTDAAISIDAAVTELQRLCRVLEQRIQATATERLTQEQKLNGLRKIVSRHINPETSTDKKRSNPPVDINAVGLELTQLQKKIVQLTREGKSIERDIIYLQKSQREQESRRALLLTTDEHKLIVERLNYYQLRGYEAAKVQREKLMATWGPAEVTKILRLCSARWNVSYELINAELKGTYCFEHLQDIAHALGCTLDPTLLVDYVLKRAPGATLAAYNDTSKADMSSDESKAFTEDPLSPGDLRRLRALGITSGDSLSAVYDHLDQQFGHSKNKEILMRLALLRAMENSSGDAPIPMIFADDNLDILDSYFSTLKEIQRQEPELWRRLDIKVLQIGPSADQFEEYASTQDIWLLNAWSRLRSAERHLYEKLAQRMDLSDEQLMQQVAELTASGAFDSLDPRKILSRREAIIQLEADQFGHMEKYIRHCMVSNPLFFKFHTVILVHAGKQVLNTRVQLHAMGDDNAVDDDKKSLENATSASGYRFMADHRMSQLALDEQQRLNPPIAARRCDSIFSSTAQVVSALGPADAELCTDPFAGISSSRQSKPFLSTESSEVISSRLPLRAVSSINASENNSARSSTRQPLQAARRRLSATDRLLPENAAAVASSDDDESQMGPEHRGSRGHLRL